ncbi:MAG: phosphomannomutase/phosphoglucomutase [bacterium]
MIMNKQIFREYDIRGKVGQDLTPDVVKNLGKAFGSYIQQKIAKNNLVVGRDNRNSSPSFFNYLVDGLLETGCNVLDIGIVPTPLFYFSLHHFKKDGGVMITASHNPPEFNGFKMCIGKDTIYGHDIQRIKDTIEGSKYKTGTGRIEKGSVTDAYLEMINKKIQLNKKIKIVVDAGNGTASLIAPQVLSSIGCEVIELFCKLDGNFPNHFPDPTVPENLSTLIKRVKEEKADLGIGYDGDADRIGTVDENGDIIWGDSLLILFARDVLKKNKGAKIIYEVKSSQNLEEDIINHGGLPIMWKAGHSLIKSKMKEEGALLAGEMSGHMFFADDYYGFDDAIYASCKLAQIISDSNCSLSNLLNNIPKTHATPEIRVDCSDEIKFEVVEEVKKGLKEDNKFELIDIDGVRIKFDEGWGLLRASNTQPAIVLRFEARSQEALEQYKDFLFDKLKKGMDCCEST